MKIQEVNFEYGSIDKVQDAEQLPEILFVGRSNVGKSTLINSSCRRKNLAKASKNPGSTRSINSYKARLSTGDGEKVLRLIDVPGFGYAKYSKKEREHLWQRTLHFLENRETLKLVLILMDPRRAPGDEELYIRDLCFELVIPAIVVLTKVDKTKKSSRKSLLSKFATSLGLELGDTIALPLDQVHGEFWKRVALFL